MARRRRRRAAPVLNHERWLVSYADFITLLFAFFTTMYAISTVDAQKLTKMVASMQVALKGDPLDAPPVPLPLPASPATPLAPRLDNLVELRRQLTGRLQRSIAQGHVTDLGSHDQLLNAGGRSARLFELQAAGYRERPGPTSGSACGRRHACPWPPAGARTPPGRCRPPTG